MANIEFNDIQHAVSTARKQARQGLHIERARQMLAAATIASVSIVVVAALFLARLI